MTPMLAQKIFPEPVLPLPGNIDLMPFLIMFSLLTAGSVIMRIRLATPSGGLGLKTGQIYWPSRGAAIGAWALLWSAIAWVVFSSPVTAEHRTGWIIFYGTVFPIVTFSYLVPLLRKTDSRQPMRTALQSLSFGAFVVGMHPCACMVRDFLRGMGFVNVNNTQAFQYMSLCISVFAFGLVWGRVFCGWVCPIGFLQEVFTSLPKACEGLGKRAGLIRPEGLARRTKQQIRFGSAAVLLVLVTVYFMLAGAVGGGQTMLQGIMVYWLMGLLVLTMLAVADPKWEVRLRSVRYVAIILFCTVVVVGVYVYAAFCVLFTNTIDTATIALFGGLLATTLILSQAWCRFLCPEGAVLSLLTTVSGWKINLDMGKCSGCNDCNDVCPVEAIDMGKVDEHSCLYCCKCVDNCPTDALDMVHRPPRGTLVRLPVVQAA